jgi:heavy metal translocating P-type ATPase
MTSLTDMCVALKAARDPLETRCDLCGLPTRRVWARKDHLDNKRFFCCPGCMHVFEILSNHPEGPPSDFTKTELYRNCSAMGLIPSGEADASAEPAVLSQQNVEADLAEELTLKIEGMWCYACAGLIGTLLQNSRGILDAEVSFLSDTARIKYLPHRIRPQDIVKTISKVGYGASILTDQTDKSREMKDQVLRLGVSAILTVNIMMLSFSLYFGFFEELGGEAIAYLSYPIGILAVPVVLYGGFPIFKRAYWGCRSGNMSMEFLIALGASAAFLYSIVQLQRGSLHLYFDTAAMLITLVLFGKYIEIRARQRVCGGVKELYKMANQKVRLLDEEREKWISHEVVKPGDEFLVVAGEAVPVDGVVRGGQANVDESCLTGEPRPLAKGVGDEIMGGTLILDGQVRVAATRVGSDSAIGRMVALVQEALSKKTPIENFCDRVVRWLIPALLALLLATATCLFARGYTVDQVLLRALAILVITCPCALGVAVPLAKVAAIGLGRSRGILIQDPIALERMRELDVMIFDKTGTLTEGNFRLQKVFTFGITKKEVLRLVGSVEAHSDHFLAREICRQARTIFSELEPVQHYEAHKGLGVAGVVQGLKVFVGNLRFMQIQEIGLSPAQEGLAASLAKQGATIVFFGWQGKVRGLLPFSDTLKTDAREVIQRINAKGIELWVVSGDSREATGSVAHQLGIENVRGQALPGEKAELIKALQRKGHIVGMVGDGVNDMVALVQADVGVALGGRLHTAQRASGITILSENLTRVLDARHLSNLTMGTIRMNLFFACIYNALAIPLAVSGSVSPLVAVFAMFASSLTVIGNTGFKLSAKPGRWAS